MGSTTTLAAYRERLTGLLRDAEASLSATDLALLRSSVHEHRNRRRGHEQAVVPPDLAPRVDAVVSLLEDASRRLRPREVQELDDLVAGKVPPEPEPEPRSAKRRARGTMRAL